MLFLAGLVCWLCLGFLGAMLSFHTDEHKAVIYADELFKASLFGAFLLIPMLARYIRKLFRRLRAWLCAEPVFRKNVNVCCDGYYS